MWGLGPTKTVSRLLREIEKGEGNLIIDAGGELLRVLTSLCINIRFAGADGKSYELVEESRTFPDGTVTDRKDLLEGSVAGKVGVDEEIFFAARRELKEELGIDFTGPLRIEKRTEETRKSKSYPGLNTLYLLTVLGMEMPPEHYKPEGYIEIQDDITTIFAWKEIT